MAIHSFIFAVSVRLKSIQDSKFHTDNNFECNVQKDNSISLESNDN